MRWPALAFDYDGTLATEGVLAHDTAEALQAVRATGRKLLLVSGRIHGQLLHVCPLAPSLFDVLVVENGGVLVGHEGRRLLAPELPNDLLDALAERGVPVQRGLVLLATLAQYEEAVRDAVAVTGLGCDLSFNRESLMLLPPGISKHSGLLAALHDLGIDPAETIAVGDAENDVELFDACGRKVAVGNAVPLLKDRADLVLEAPNGAGVRELLGRVLRDELP